ncbi:MAG: V-type ATP synthase subunit E family protein [Candidatus Methanosuratincola sp.]|uniref:V-ATPase subunit E n=2 Tax=Candidatus Methanosuratincola (ex Vanwonterghem et al. 2016) TaxID=1915412 RepID=A0A7J3V0H6_9CREN|nr:V-type ATP synthase subunit E family protein [Candidatus Methanosuratincola sp.]RWX72931.1 MAG: V-type ATP synthase subunit E [Candidatus Methanosuratincola subterraneus]
MSGKPVNLQRPIDTEGFNRLISALFEETGSKVDALMAEALNTVESIMSESKKYSIRRSNEILDSYIESSEVEYRKEISKAEIDARMQALRIKEEVIEGVFDEARERLLEFAEKEEYLEIMQKQLTSISSLFHVGKVVLNKRDFERLGEDTIRKILGPKCDISVEDLGTGGFVLISKDGKVAIDRTIDSILKSKKDEMRGRVAEKLFG